MKISNVRFTDFKTVQGYTTSLVTFTYKNKQYTATIMESVNGLSVLNITKLDGVSRKASINYNSKQDITKEIEVAYKDLLSKVNAYEAATQGLTFDTLLAYYNEYLDSESVMGLYEWMDSKGY